MSLIVIHTVSKNVLPPDWKKQFELGVNHLVRPVCLYIQVNPKSANHNCSRQYFYFLFYFFFFFFNFSKKTSLDISCETIHMKYQRLVFFEKLKK